GRRDRDAGAPGVLRRIDDADDATHEPALASRSIRALVSAAGREPANPSVRRTGRPTALQRDAGGSTLAVLNRSARRSLGAPGAGMESAPTRACHRRDVGA